MLSSRRLREIVLLTLGVITPVGILAVNASAFVMVHLTQFRIGIAACALVSGLVLNGLTAWWLLRLASRTAPPLRAAPPPRDGRPHAIEYDRPVTAATLKTNRGSIETRCQSAAGRRS